MEPIQIGLLGVSGFIVLVGVVKSFRRRPEGEKLERVTIREDAARCRVCGNEAEEYDDLNKRWVCFKHAPQIISGQLVKSKRKSWGSRQQRAEVEDIHTVETVRDPELLRGRRSRQDEYEEYDDVEEDICVHGRYAEECRTCYENEQAQLAQRRPQRQQAQPQSRRQPQREVQRQRQQQAQPQSQSSDVLDYAVEIVEEYPDISDAELARVLGMRRADSARAYRIKALDILGLLPQVQGQRVRSRR